MSNAEEKAYIEAEYSCVYCGQKGRENLSTDHIDGDAFAHANKYDNLTVLCHNCHHKKTNGKGITVEDVKRLKKMLIEKTLTPFGVNALKLACRNDFGVTVNPLLVYHLVDLGLFKEDEVLTSTSEDGKEVATETLFLITDEGKRLCNKWF